MPDRSRKRPSDKNQLAKSIVDMATGTAPKPSPADKDPAAVALGRKGGLKGGKARAKAMTPKQRSASAKKAAKARWETSGS
jgi:hypothetical protein